MDFMNNLETNAIKIAELMGVKTHISIMGAFGTVIGKVPNTGVINKFMDYNGLMPIVCECNSVFASNVSHEIEISRYFVRIHIADLNQSADVVPEIDSYSFDYNTEPEFIEALQLAVIKYLEIKNDNSRVQQTI